MDHILCPFEIKSDTGSDGCITGYGSSRERVEISLRRIKRMCQRSFRRFGRAA